MGAFTTADEAGVAVVPVIIRGTRSILRADSWFPRRGRISITVAAPIDPKAFQGGNDHDPWRTAVAIRDEARSAILARCAEPDLVRERTEQG
jgi:1-acyl-sn-glycerol-3-phosphate acyltransferase